MIAFAAWRVLLVALLFAGALHAVSRNLQPHIRIGTRILHRCLPRNGGVSVAGYCGVLRVPLDWDDPSSGTIGIRFQFVPARRLFANGTIVAQEGGPGFPSTGSGSTYQRVFGPLLAGRDLLLMDERGTGASAAVDCKPLQRAVSSSRTEHVQAAIAACGAQLDHSFRTLDGRRFVHASDLFAPTQSVRDLAAIVRALDLGPIDLYGDSYGTFFAQAFAANNPELVRSLVLDGAYPLDQDFVGARALAEIRFAYDAVCARSPACHHAARGSSVDRIRRLARLLDTSLLRAGKRTYDAGDLDALLGQASYNLVPLEYRDLDAAARAMLERRDGVPLARLFRWSKRSAAAQTPSSYTEYSAGMKFSAECTVYRSPFDMRAPYAERARQFARAMAALPASLFDPIPKSVAVDSANQWFDQCIRWPAPVHTARLVERAPPLVPPQLPVLIISGDLDATTPPGDARAAAARLGASVRFVSVPNAIHGPSYNDWYGCVRGILRTFVTSPQSALDASCVDRLPEVRAVGVFPQTLADQPPGSRGLHDGASIAEARLAALAVGAVGDAVRAARFLAVDGESCDDGFCGSGLRGGKFVADSYLSGIELRSVAFSRDSAVSGTVTLAETSNFYSSPGVITATVHAKLRNGTIAEDLTLRWDERKKHAVATIDGRSSSRHAIHETVPAP